MNIEGAINIEKVTIGGIDYFPQKEYVRQSCNGCDLYNGVCPANKVCNCFGNGIILKKKGRVKPTLTDYTTIHSYVDACIALDRSPVANFDKLCINDSLAAFIQLMTIAEAIRGHDGAIPNDNKKKVRYYAPKFIRISYDEIKEAHEDVKRTALWVDNGEYERELFACVSVEESETTPYFGYSPTLLQLSQSKARYFGGRRFIQLWAMYYGMTFKTDNYFREED